MLRRFGIVLTCLAMFAIAGGHWAVLQSVAWAGMVAEYSQTSSLVQSLRKALSGEDPCSMCRAIEKGKASESRLPAVAESAKKWDGFFQRGSAAAPAPHESDFSYPPDNAAEVAHRSSAPPAPVPITA